MKKPRLFFKKFYLSLVMLFLYIPIVVMLFQSFNAGKSRAKWEGFSLRYHGRELRWSAAGRQEDPAGQQP